MHVADVVPEPRTRRIAATYLASGVAAVGASYVVAGDGPAFLVTAAAVTVLYLLPDALLTWGILTLGEYGRPALVAGAAVATVGLFAALAAGAVVLADRLDRQRADAVFGVGLGQAGAAFLLTVHPGVAVAAGVAGTAAVGLAGPAVTDGRSTPGRRAVLKSLGVAAGAVGLGGLVAPRADPVPEEPTDDPAVAAMLDVAAERSLDVPGLEPLVSENFFQVDINTTTPVLDRDEWTLAVEGGPRAFTVDYDGLTARTPEHRFVSIRCVSDEVNGRLLDTALWTGIPIDRLLEEADAPAECCVRVEAHDGYYHAFPREYLDRGFLAWRMNGELLPRGHGHPVRLLVPGHWGEINLKWITRIEIRDEPATGYWEERGWFGSGPVATVAKAHAVDAGPDGTVVAAGHAYAGRRGVSRVEVSVDGGDTWTDAELSEPLPGAVPATPPNDGDGDGDDTVATGDADGADVEIAGEATDAWRMWRHEYEAVDPHELVVRAVERDGTVQTVAETDPHPEGATGWVRREVDPR